MLTKLPSVRIVRWPLKLAYVVGALILGWFVVRVPEALGASADIAQTIAVVFDLGAILLGARIFRGQGEPIEPARAWWRMTAWPTLSRRLGILFTVLAVLAILSEILSYVGVRPPMRGQTLYTLIISSLWSIAVAFLYLNSAVRLKRAGIVKPQPEGEPKLARAPKLD